MKLKVVNQPIGQFVEQDYLKDPFASGYWYDNKYAAQCISQHDQNGGPERTALV